MVNGIKWPMTGGIVKQLVDAEGRVGRLYVAGYEDGSVRIWDATYPVLYLLCVLQGEVRVPQSTFLRFVCLKQTFFVVDWEFKVCISINLQVKGVEVTGSSSSVSKLDFCSLTFCLAVGNKYGLVRWVLSCWVVLYLYLFILI